MPTAPPPPLLALARRLTGSILTSLMAASLLVVTPIVAAAPASAAPEDNFSLAKSNSVGGEALIGEEITYTLTATGTQSSDGPLYNLSFRDVLPAGVEYVAANPPPTAVLIGVPAGQTTVIWSNVSDLPAKSQASVEVTVETNPDFAPVTGGSTTVPVGAVITNNGEAVASVDAFTIPDYSTATGLFTGDFDGSATAADTVEIIPFRVSKAAPAELLRGVHAAGGGTIGSLYTVTVENNPDYAVNAVTLVDTLHPGLEFLGCEDYYPLDNTTVAEEWTGAGAVATGPAGASCAPTPSTVSTGAGGETIVTWSLGNLAPGEIKTVTYRAGIPLFENRPFPATPTPPTAASLDQGRNLDNNTGTSTGELDRTTNPDPELLTAPERTYDNTATATGTYTPTTSSESDTAIHVVESEDLVINKSMSGSLVQGTTVVTTLTIATSEYRNSTNLVVRDLLPSSLCFLGTFNDDDTPGTPDWNTTDCAGAGTIRSTINGSPVDVSRVRELPSGGPYGTGRFELVWDFADPDNSALASLPADGTLTIQYTAVVRDFYRDENAQVPAAPILAGDTSSNAAEVSGPGFQARSLPLDAANPEGGIDGDTTSASIGNSLPSLDKRVSVKTGPLANGANATKDTCLTSYGAAVDPIVWSEGNPTPELGYGPGDIVCFELGATFPADLDYAGVKIQDLLPPGYRYLTDSAKRVPAVDTIGGTTAAGSARVVTFIVGDAGLVNPSGNTFRWVIAAEFTANNAGAANDINANLQKMVHNNSAGLVYQYRDEAAAVWTEPQVRLAKGVDHVNTAASNGPDFDNSLGGEAIPVEVVADDEVVFRIDVWNTGNTDALETEVQDHLPAGFDCGDITANPDGATCAAGVLTWTGLTVAASTGAGDPTPDVADNETTAPITLEYTLTVPDDIDPDQSWTNTAGVARYETETNQDPDTDPAPVANGVYYPADNIDSDNELLENTDAADDPAYLDSPDLTIVKLQRSGIDEAGNLANSAPATDADEATIGEIIQYEVTVTIPEGTTVFDGEITDQLPAGIDWFTGNGLFAGTVADLQPTVTSSTGTTALTGGTITHAAGTVHYVLPATHVNLPGSGDDSVTITFYGQVTDIGTNEADPTPTVLANSAGFDWNDSSGSDRPDITSDTIDTLVVEPNPAIVKDHTDPSGTDVGPGDPITYRIAVTNSDAASNVSIAHDVTIVDRVPVGLTPLGASDVPVSANGDPVPSVGLAPAASFDGIWSQDDRTITWTPADWAALDALDPDATVELTFRVEVDFPAVASSELANEATFTAYSLDQDLSPTDDPNETDARTYTGTDDDTVYLPLAELTKDLEPFNAGDPDDDIEERTVGEPVDYQLAVTVPDGTILYDATVFDTLPTTLDFDSFGAVDVGPECEVFDAAFGTTTGSSLPGTDVETINPVGADARSAAWFLGDVFANGECTVTLEYTAHVNTSAVDADSVDNGAVTTWNSTDQVDDDQVAVEPFTLPVGFDDPESSSWTQDSGIDDETFTVVEPTIAVDKDVSDGAGSPLLDPGCDTTPGNNDNVTDDADGSPANGCDTTAASELRYTITTTNTGTSDAHDLTIVDTVPTGLTPLDTFGGTPVATTGDTVTGSPGSVGTWNEITRTITWTVTGPVAPTEFATVDYAAVVDPADTLSRGQELTNTADVPSFFGLSSTERAQIVADNPLNDDLVEYGSGGAAVRGVVAPDSVSVEVHFPDLAVTKQPTVGQDPTDVRLDQPFSWTVVVTNTDAVAAAFEVDVTDVLPVGWTYDLGSALVTTPHNGGPMQVDPTCTTDTGPCDDAASLNIETLSWNGLVTGVAEPLDAGETITLVFTATPQSAALTSTQAIGESFTGYDAGAGFAHTNNVAVSGEDAGGSTICCDPDGSGPLLPESYGDDAADSVYIARADIEVAKAISPVEDNTDAIDGPYWFGSSVDYTVTVDNAGPDGATNVTIADVLDPSELEFVSQVSADQGSYDDTTDTWTIGTVASGASFDLVLRVRLVALGPVVNIAQNATTDQYDSDSTPGNDVAAEDDQDSVSITVVPTSLGDFVWLDLNDDGIQDSDEPGIPGVGITITWEDPGGGGVQTYITTTGAGGSYGVPPSAGLPADTDITVSIDTASPNLVGLVNSFDRDGDLDGGATDQITTADTLPAGGPLADLAFDFGYTPDGAQSIGDTIWWDQDDSADDTNGVGEIRVSGVEVTATWAGFDGLLDTADDIDFFDTTDSLGNYLFDQVPPGEYRITVDPTSLPPGLTTQTYDLDGLGAGSVDTAEIFLDPGEGQLDVDFSYRGAGTIGDTVWFDHDGDGSQDTGEPGLGGVTVTLTWVGGNGIEGSLTTLTDADGKYQFEYLPYGDYTVTLSTLPSGLVPTSDADGHLATPNVSTTTLSALQPSDVDQDFGYRGLGSIGDTVFYDVDALETDGFLDAGDAPIAGVAVTVVWSGVDDVFGTDDDFVFTDTTDDSGNYLVTDLPHGRYTVTVDAETLPVGLDQATYDSDGTASADSSAVTLTSGSPSDLNQDFSYTGATSGQIGDTVFFDQNGNGIEDSGEIGFSGVTVTLVWFGPDGDPGTADDVIQTTVTGPNGDYLFDNLPQGVFSVSVDALTVPAGLTPTVDDDGHLVSPNVSLVTLDATVPSDLDQDFGYAGVGSLGDLVWYDIDNSATATADPGEPGLGGVEITVVWTNPQGEDVTFMVTTQPDGTYTVPFLPHGSYAVSVDPLTLPPGMTATFDDDGTGSPNATTVVLDATTPVDADQDFSYTGVGSLGDTVWFDQNDDGAVDPTGLLFDDQDQPLAGIGLIVTWAGPDGIIGDDPDTALVDEAADDVEYSATTDTDGVWGVAYLPFGAFRVDVDTATLPPGLTAPTFDFDGTDTANTSTTTLTGTNPDDLDQDFSYTGAGTLGDTVWFDRDGDGEIGPDEVGLAGVTVTLGYTGPDGTDVDVVTTTDADGAYLFENLPFDTVLTVTVVDTTLPPGFVPVFDIDGIDTPNVSTTTLTDATPDDLDQDFGYNGNGSLGDTVWYDRNDSATSTLDAGDVGIPDVDVTIVWTNPTGGPDYTITVTTDSDGIYLLTGLPHGDYTVTVDPDTLPTGTVPTYDDDGIVTPLASVTTLDAGTPDDLDQDFSVTGTGSIGDTLWKDDDADGVYDPDEEPISGVTVTLTYLDPVSGLVFTDTTTTDADGVYLFEDLPAGAYTITVVTDSLPGGYLATFDVDGITTPHVSTLDLGEGESRTDVDFGYRPEVDLSMVKTHVGDFTVGSTNTWTLTVTNAGPAAAEAPVTITDSLPVDVTYVDSVGDDWACTAAAATVTCTFVDDFGTPVALDDATTTSVGIRVNIDAGAAPGVTNTATVATPTYDTDPDNDSDDDDTEVPLSILAIDKRLDGRLEADRTATYVLTVVNLGPTATRGDVIVTDDLPTGLRYETASSDIVGATCSEVAGTVTCTNPATMAVGDTWTIELDVEVTAAVGTRIVNDATVNGGNQVNGTPLAPETLADIYARLDDPLSELYGELGISPDASPDDNGVSDQTVAAPRGFLPFTGADSGQLVLLGLTLLAWGLALVAVSRRRELSR